MVGSVRLGLNMNKKIKKASSKQTKRGSFVKELVNYLKSDSFLYSQLISSSNSANSLPPISTQDKNGTEGGNKMKESEEYLKSDTYMYAPLLRLPLTPPKQSPPPPPPPQPKERSRNQVKKSSRNVYATTNVVAHKTRRVARRKMI